MAKTTIQKLALPQREGAVEVVDLVEGVAVGHDGEGLHTSHSNLLIRRAT